MFGGIFEDASIVDWILLLGLTAGLCVRVLEWYWRQGKLVDNAPQYVTRQALEQELEIRGLKSDENIKHWTRNELSDYYHNKQAEELSRRIERLEDKK